MGKNEEAQQSARECRVTMKHAAADLSLKAGYSN
jgi:hypothetical protein